MSTSIYDGHTCHLCGKPAKHYSESRDHYWCAKNPSSCEKVKEKRKQTFLEIYKTDNPSKNKDVKNKISASNKEKAPEAKEKRKKTVMELYKVEYVGQIPGNLEKQIATNLELYGVEHPMQLQEYQDMVKETCREKYGCDFPSQNADVRAQTIETNIKLYGGPVPLSSQEIKDKVKSTCQSRYGVDNPSQDPDIAERIVKNQMKSKEYILPSGKIILIQGYENKALDDLLTIYDENEIITDRSCVPRINYIDFNGSHRYYFPDIYIPKDNLILEVKSEWTYKCGTETHLCKRSACLIDGYNFEFMIYK